MGFVGQLYDFQQQAADQLLSWGGGLLSLTMGAGKTPCAIYIVEELLDAEEIEMALIVVPPNLRRQWRAQLGIFAPDATVSLIEGTPAQRARQYAWARENAEYVIIGYPALLNDWEHLQELPTECIVADECQALKNFRAKRSRKMKRLGGGFRLGLTGQPLENRPEDVFSIMEWNAPGFLGRFDVYDRTYIVRDDWGRPLRYRNLDHLASRLRDEVMVRYSREDIADQLPERIYQNIDVPLDPKTRRIYSRIADDLLDWLSIAAEAGVSNFSLSQVYGQDESEESWEIRGEIAARLLALRMLCDHPQLLQISASKFAAAGGEGSEYIFDLIQPLDMSKLPAPKFDVAVELIQMILDEDPANKVALFSFFKGTLALLLERFPEVSVIYHGDVDSRHKQLAVDAFNADPSVRVFLSSDAGGSGVDLPAGNYHINYDLPFSAGQLAQRNARLDRVSSQHDRLTVINLLTEETVEQFYFEVLIRRQLLADAVLDNGAKRVRSVDMDLGSLRSFLLGTEDAT